MKGSPIPFLATVPVLVLAAGHGGKDSGAENGKFNERDEVISIVDQIAASLRRQLPAKSVIIAPHGHDTHETIPWLNSKFPHLASAWAIEVHRDSSDVKGDDADLRCGMYYGNSGDSRTVATMTLGELKAHGAHRLSWARCHTESPHRSLGFIRQPSCLSHILELGFMEGRNDPQHLARLARLAAASIAKIFAGIATVSRPGELLT